MITLLLTKAERTRFAALPKELTGKTTVSDETIDAYETDKDLAIRANMAELGSVPGFKKLSDDLRAGKKVDPASMASVPEEAMPELLFSIGARGISVLMGELLSTVKTAEDIEAIAGLSVLRHDILTANSQVLSR